MLLFIMLEYFVLLRNILFLLWSSKKMSPAKKNLFTICLVENPWHRLHIRHLILSYICRSEMLFSEERFISILLPIYFLKAPSKRWFPSASDLCSIWQWLKFAKGDFCTLHLKCNKGTTIKDCYNLLIVRTICKTDFCSLSYRCQPVLRLDL